jgi:FkbM family methyltransferase
MKIDPESLIVRTERGLMRRLPPGMVLWANAQLHRRFGEPELHELKHLVTPGSIAIDVGAHFGTFSYALSRLVGKKGLVLSFEPIEEDAQLIERGATFLRLPVEVQHYALSSQSGSATIHIPYLHGAEKTALSSLEGTSAADGETRTITVRRLDDVLAARGDSRPVSFIKIDVEGHEIAVLNGAMATLAKHRPNLLIEVNNDSGPDHMREVFDLITTQGYRGEFLEAGKYRKPLSAFDMEKHQLAAAGNVLSDAYVNNFIFMPESDRATTAGSPLLSGGIGEESSRCE